MVCKIQNREALDKLKFGIRFHCLKGKVNHKKNTERCENHIAPQFYTMHRLPYCPQTNPEENHCVEVQRESCKNKKAA